MPAARTRVKKTGAGAMALGPRRAPRREPAAGQPRPASDEIVLPVRTGTANYQPGSRLTKSPIKQCKTNYIYSLKASGILSAEFLLYAGTTDTN